MLVLVTIPVPQSRTLVVFSEGIGTVHISHLSLQFTVSQPFIKGKIY